LVKVGQEDEKVKQPKVFVQVEYGDEYAVGHGMLKAVVG
jgi:hypothetical protein